jgi:hypothetical protein
MTQPKRWVVTTSPDHEFGEVARELASRGFTIEQQMDAIGVVVGSAHDDVAEGLKGVKGVTDVSPDAPIDIGPPGSSDTW